MPASRSRLGVIFLTVLIDLIGFGIVIPILPGVAVRFGAKGFEFGALLGVYSLMQFFATALLGRMSDRVGRRPILLGTMVLNAGGYLLFAFAGSYTALFVARVISGFAGGNISAAQAYVADSTSAAERSRGMGMIGAAFGIGFALGPALGGVAAHFGGPAAPGLVAAGLSLVNLVSAWLILPESLHAQHRTARRGLGFEAIARGLADPRLRPLMLVWGIFPFAFAGYTAALPLHARVTFGWRDAELGVFFTVFGLTTAFVQGLLFGRLARRFGERTLVIAGTMGVAVAIGAVPFAHHSLGLYAWTIALAFSQGLVSPGASGLVSVYASPSEQGVTLGAAQALGALGRMLGPEVIGKTYDVAGARTAFLAAGGVMLLAWVASLRLEPVSHAPATPPPAA
ncbi:MAG TPA: MFS transporter [Gemmatimonadales bacterium]|jgi:MFS family permease|nr:MFS transporter [Gemmatimonadales bacterium]